MNAGASYRFRAASNGGVAWRDVAVFTVSALLLVRVVGAVALEALFPNAPDFVIDLVDNYAGDPALLMLLFVSREGLRARWDRWGHGASMCGRYFSPRCSP